mgnify:CR=1 FL=1
MTHEGPAGSSTASNANFIANYEKKVEPGNIVTYFMGSPKLTELLTINRERIVCDIHGHSHDGSFIQNIGKPREVLPVINPGSLGQNEFAEITISKINGKWKMTEANKIYF